MASHSSRRCAGPKEIHNGMQSVPTSLTAVNTLDSIIYQIVVANNTAGAITFLVTDTAGNPIVPTISCAANQLNVIPFYEGVSAPGGIKWQAGGANLFAEIYGNSHI